MNTTDPSHPVTMAEPSLSDIMRSLSNIDKKIEKEVNSIKNDLGKSISDQVNTLENSLKRSIDDAVAPIAKRQDELELKSDERFKKLEDTVQNLSKCYDEVIAATKSSTTDPSFSTPHPSPAWPQTYAEATRFLPPSDSACPASVSNTVSATGDSSAIADLIEAARKVIGIGPVFQSDFDHFSRDNPDDAVRLAAIEALRCDLNIKEEEIKDDDIENTFLPPKATKVPRVYVRFFKQEHADLCLRAAKTLKNSETKVFRYFPRQFQARVRALEEVAYPMRKQQDPGYKTEVVYTATDVQLLVCPRGLTRYQPYHVTHLPPIDMAPIRSPPPGRPRHKRNRSGTPSPEAPSKSTRYQPPTPPNNESEDPPHGQSDKHPDPDPVKTSFPDKTPPPLSALPDLGGVSSMEVTSPRTGRVSFNFQDPVNLRRQSGNF